MKLLILGARGMAGHTISLYFNEKGYDVYTLTRTPFNFFQNTVGDVLDKENLKTVLYNGNFDVVINCVGILNQFAENNKSQGVYLNSFLPHFLSDLLKETKTKLIHMSTDCVFAGNTGPYHEGSFRDGITFYDRTKALGEIEDDKNLTFRNSIIGPDINHSGIGLFNWFMNQSGTINGFTKAIWTGVTTLTLSKAMERAIAEDLCGIYNLVNNEFINKYDLLCLFNKYFRNDKIIINTDDSLILDKSLVNNRRDFSFQIPSYETMIDEMKEWIDMHSDLYPNYR